MDFTSAEEDPNDWIQSLDGEWNVLDCCAVERQAVPLYCQWLLCLSSSRELSRNVRAAEPSDRISELFSSPIQRATTGAIAASITHSSDSQDSDKRRNPSPATDSIEVCQRRSISQSKCEALQGNELDELENCPQPPAEREQRRCAPPRVAARVDSLSLKLRSKSGLNPLYDPLTGKNQRRAENCNRAGNQTPTSTRGVPYQATKLAPSILQ